MCVNFFTDRYHKNIEGLTSRSPYYELLQFDKQKIVTKVRTLITQVKRRIETAEKKKTGFQDARLNNPTKKGKGKKSKSIDNPKL